MASFSRVAGKPIKLWDIRRMDSTLGEVRVVSSSSSPDTINDTVEAIKWGIHEPGILTVATGGSFHDFDTRICSRPTLVGVRHTHRGPRIRDFALYPSRDGMGDLPNPLVDTLYNHRVLTVLDGGEIFDMAKHTHAPISISHRTGQIFHSLGSSLFNQLPASGTFVERGCQWLGIHSNQF